MQHTKKLINALKPFPCVFILCLIFAVYFYLSKYFPNITLDEIFFFLKAPKTGVDPNLIHRFMQSYFIYACLLSVLICWVPNLIDFCRFIGEKILKISYAKTISFGSGFVLLICLINSCYTNEEELKDIFLNDNSSWFEENFVEPRDEIISFKEEKKNLLILHIESLEKTFSNNLFFEKSLIPDLEQLESEGFSFEDYQSSYAADFTEGSIIALFTGLPANYVSGHIMLTFGRHLNLLLSYLSLGKILKNNDYQTLALFGADGHFAGKALFLKTHGMDDITDKMRINMDYPHYLPVGHWGYSDEDIFSILKDKIKNLDSDKPFFIYTLTVDTHFAYEPKIKRPHKFENAALDTIYNTNLQIAAFIKWFKKHPSYKKTAVVIIGDHLRMGDDFAQPAHRRIYNLFLNTKKPKNLKRKFSQLDLFPTILESVGATIKDHRLGLGVSLFDDHKTLRESLGDEELTKRLRRKTRFYKNLWR